jgi:plasmid stabilization system protein ParE
MRVEIKKRADTNIKKLVLYIAEKGYPNTAENYVTRLYDFLFALAAHPNAYTLCKNKKWAALKYHCAVFEGTYVIPFKTKGKVVYIMNIIHGARLK